MKKLADISRFENLPGVPSDVAGSVTEASVFNYNDDGVLQLCSDQIQYRLGRVDRAKLQDSKALTQFMADAIGQLLKSQTFSVCGDVVKNLPDMLGPYYKELGKVPIDRQTLYEYVQKVRF